MGNPVFDFAKSLDPKNILKMGVEFAGAQLIATGIILGVTVASNAVVDTVRELKKAHDEAKIEEKIQQDLQCEN